MSEQTHEIVSGTGKKKFSMYLIGILLCLILTLIPFATVMYSTLANTTVLPIIFSAAILQFLVQIIFFLRLNISNEAGKMNVMAFIFSLIILATIVGGSLWIMWSLHYNMMYH